MFSPLFSAGVLVISIFIGTMADSVLGVNRALKNVPLGIRVLHALTWMLWGVLATKLLFK